MLQRPLSSMLLRCGGSRDVCFVSHRISCPAGLDVLVPGVAGELATVRDRSAVTAQDHGPAAPRAARLASHGRPADLGARLPDRLHRSHRDRPHPLAAT